MSQLDLWVKTHPRTTKGRTVIVKRHKRAKKPHLIVKFGPRGAPKPGEKGYRPPVQPAGLAMLDRARQLLDQPEMFHLIHALEIGSTDPDDLPPYMTMEDLPDWIGVPLRGTAGVDLTTDERIDIAYQAVMLAIEVDRGPTGHDFKAADRDDHGLVAAVWAESIVEGPFPTAKKLRIVNVSKAEAAAFIERHHGQLPKLNPKGLMYAIGAMKRGRLVAVATAGHPTGPWKYAPADAHLPKEKRRRLDQRNVLEVTRVASDGSVLGVASALTARLIDLAAKSRRGNPDEPWLLVTYQIEGERGAPYRALREKGLRPVLATKGKTAGGRRPGGSSLGEVNKIRWEAGPAAGPADWSLLAPKD